MTPRRSNSAEFLLKVCGVTSIEDALSSVRYGANAVGFNFYPRSPRFIEPGKAEQIAARLPEGVLKVGVFVKGAGPAPPDFIDAVQLHGYACVSELPSLRKRIIVAVSPEMASRFPDHEIIIDTSWGSGRQADWSQLRELGRPFILSGGLTSENVAEAIHSLSPAGVDVCSGVERFPGKKDETRLRAFLEAASTAYGVKRR